LENIFVFNKLLFATRVKHSPILESLTWIYAIWQMDCFADVSLYQWFAVGISFVVPTLDQIPV